MPENKYRDGRKNQLKLNVNGNIYTGMSFKSKWRTFFLRQIQFHRNHAYNSVLIEGKCLHLSYECANIPKWNTSFTYVFRVNSIKWFDFFLNYSLLWNFCSTSGSKIKQKQNGVEFLSCPFSWYCCFQCGRVLSWLIQLVEYMVYIA